MEIERHSTLGAEREREVNDGLWEQRGKTETFFSPESYKQERVWEMFGARGGSRVPGVQDDAGQRQRESLGMEELEEKTDGCECQAANIYGRKQS